MTKQATKFTVSQAQKFVNTARPAPAAAEGAGRGSGRRGWPTRPASRTVGLGAFAALIVLLIVFGSLLAAALPLITAGLALGTGTPRSGCSRTSINMASFSSQLSLLIGLGVGVDYALFIVTRYRQGLQRGKSVEDAIVDAIDTSGRAVMFAGMTSASRCWGCSRSASASSTASRSPPVVVAFTVLAR
jgi:RND superfamily putative drug exporter